jgi:quercetin dioxygenase-like cupin family protein
MTEADRLREPPRERLVDPIQLVDLSEAAAALRKEPHAATEGHRQITVMRRRPVSVILYVFEADGFLHDHHAPGDVMIHVLSGRMDVKLTDRTVTLGRGGFLALAPEQPHALRAIEPTEMLLTVCQVAPT